MIKGYLINSDIEQAVKYDGSLSSIAEIQKMCADECEVTKLDGDGELLQIIHMKSGQRFLSYTDTYYIVKDSGGSILAISLEEYEIYQRRNEPFVYPREVY